MAEETILEKAGRAVGFGMAMAEDLAGGVKTAVGSAVTTVTEVLKSSPAKKAVTNKATIKVPAKKPAKKAVTKKAVKKAPVNKSAKKAVAKKAAKKSAAKKIPAKKAVKKSIKKAAKKAARRR
jgi:hypothetical protein